MANLCFKEYATTVRNQTKMKAKFDSNWIRNLISSEKKQAENEAGICHQRKRAREQPPTDEII